MALRSLTARRHSAVATPSYLAGEAVERHACHAFGRRGDQRRVHPVMLFPSAINCSATSLIYSQN